jgi:tetratricopeptide (TPR) repeat protein
LATAAVTTARTKPVKGSEQLALVQRMPKPDAPPVGSTAPTPTREVPTEKPQEATVPNNPAPRAPAALAPAPPPAAVEIRAPSDNADSKPEAERSNAADVALDTASDAATEEKRTFVQRLNPATWFRGKSKPAPITTPLDSSPRIKSTPLPPSAPAEKEKSFARADGVARVPSTTESKRNLSAPAPLGEHSAELPIPRYTFLSPKMPAPGDRAQAEQALARGVLAHSQRQLTRALEAYREAVRLDPSLFEAQYNLGLAAYELKVWPLALSSYETALSINPTSANTRFNFALALDRAGYSLDSAAQLEKMLLEHPQEGRAHFSVAKIYAEQLKQNDAAARHYRRLLELEPQHPQAVAIRQWLMAHAAVQ